MCDSCGRSPEMDARIRVFLSGKEAGDANPH